MRPTLSKTLAITPRQLDTRKHTRNHILSGMTWEGPWYDTNPTCLHFSFMQRSSRVPAITDRSGPLHSRPKDGVICVHTPFRSVLMSPQQQPPPCGLNMLCQNYRYWRCVGSSISCWNSIQRNVDVRYWRLEG